MVYMLITKFYKNELSTPDGYTLDDISHFSDYELEQEHGFIQFIFPLIEPSNIIKNCPILTEEDIKFLHFDHISRHNLKLMFYKMLGFYRFKVISDGKIVKIESPKTEDLWWLTPYNHNILRITRILKSMKLLNYFDYSLALFEELKKLKDHPAVKSKSFKFWEDVIYSNVESITVKSNNVLDLLVELGYAHSKQFARMTMRQGSLVINGIKIKDRRYIIKNNDIFRFGKQKYYKIEKE